MHWLQRDFKYSRLKRDEIRLFSFKDEKKTDVADESRELECELEHFPRNSAPKYYALSYAWGEGKHIRSIKLNGKTFDVTKNLRDGLRELRRRSHGFLHLLQSELMLEETRLYFWIDAICLNQSDLKEKESQIPKMGPVFAEAFNVIVWLGKIDPSLDENELAYQQYLIHRLQSYNYGQRKLGEVVPPPEALSKWGPREKRVAIIFGAMDMFALDWFRRVWVLQEVALAHRKPLGLLDTYMFPLQGLAHVLEMCPEYTAENDAPVFSLSSYGYAERVSNEKEFRSYLQALHSSYWTQNAALSFAQQLELVVLRKRDRACALDHDHIYGVLGLLDQTEMPKELLPNYSTPSLKVWEAFSRYIYTQTGSLALLENGGISTNQYEETGCPSWVPDFQPLVTISSDYRHSHSQEDLRFSDDGKTLSVEGVLLGKILDTTFDVEDQTHVDIGLSDKVEEEGVLSILRFRHVVNAFISKSATRLGTTTESRWLGLLNAIEDITGNPRTSRTAQMILEECSTYDGDNYKASAVIMVIIESFDQRGAVLVDNGDIFHFWPVWRTFTPRKSVAVVLKGSLTYTILEKVDNGRYRCVAQAQKLEKFDLGTEPHGLGAEFFEGKQLTRFDIV